MSIQILLCIYIFLARCNGAAHSGAPIRTKKNCTCEAQTTARLTLYIHCRRTAHIIMPCNTFCVCFGNTGAQKTGCNTKRYLTLDRFWKPPTQTSHDQPLNIKKFSENINFHMESPWKFLGWTAPKLCIEAMYQQHAGLKRDAFLFIFFVELPNEDFFLHPVRLFIEILTFLSCSSLLSAKYSSE